MKTKKVMIIIILFLLFLFIAINVKLNNLESFDYHVFELLDNIRSNQATNFFHIVTTFGNYLFIVALGILLALLLKNKQEKKYIILNVLCVGLLSQILKLIFARPRPTVMTIYRTSYSFPSAHTMLAMGTYGLLIYIINTKKDLSKKIKYVLSTILTLIILLVGISRVYLGYHFASDVIAAYLITLMYLLIFITFTWEKKKTAKEE